MSNGGSEGIRLQRQEDPLCVQLVTAISHEDHAVRRHDVIGERVGFVLS